MQIKKRIAVIPGSFDPITNGHLEIIKYASIAFDFVYVAVMINPNKNYMFNMQEREELAKVAVSGMKNVTVVASEGLLWELAKSLNACAIIKGYRNDTDLMYEIEMAKFNEAHYPEGKTFLIKAQKDFINVSSTLVRDNIKNKKNLENLLPVAVIEKIYTIYNEKM